MIQVEQMTIDYASAEDLREKKVFTPAQVKQASNPAQD